MLLSVRYTLSNGRMWIMISRYMTAYNLVIFGSTTGMTFVCYCSLPMEPVPSIIAVTVAIAFVLPWRHGCVPCKQFIKF